MSENNYLPDCPPLSSSESNEFSEDLMDQGCGYANLNSPDYNCRLLDGKIESRRGRPKAAMITSLILEGASSASGIRCEVCSRVFPRDKSLQAHRRVHTGERPYSCDYPGCMRKFKQSGQLKTHQRLHTGERPFLCSIQGCENRFTHANRHCSKHPSAPLTRCEDARACDPTIASNQSLEVKQWLLRYLGERKEPRNEKKERTFPTVVGGGGGEGSLQDMTNLRESPQRVAPKKSLFQPPISPQGSPKPLSPRKRELPKKRWLRIASREQEQNANLCRPTVLRLCATPEVGPPLHALHPYLTPPYSEEKPRAPAPSLLSPHPSSTDPSTEDVLAVPLSAYY